MVYDYAILGLESDMVYGPHVMVHWILKVEEPSPPEPRLLKAASSCELRSIVLVSAKHMDP